MHFIQTTLTIPQSKSSQIAHHSKIKDIVLLSDQKLALITKNSLTLYDLSLGKTQRQINFNMNLQQIIYVHNFNMFVGYNHEGKEIVSFCIDNETVQIKNDPGKNEYQWNPWLLLLQKSSRSHSISQSRFIIIRKLYGLSWVLIFHATHNSAFQKQWDFTCNQSDLQVLDNQKYLVNFSVVNNRHNIKFEIYNLQQKSKNNFKVQNFTEGNIIRSMKLMKVQKRPNNDKSLTIAVGLSYKNSDKSGLIIIRCLEPSNNSNKNDNVYEILLRIDVQDVISQIHDVVNDSLIVCSVYRYNQKQRETSACLVGYKYEQLHGSTYELQETSSIELNKEMEIVRYFKRNKEIIILNNIFKRHFPVFDKKSVPNSQQDCLKNKSKQQGQDIQINIKNTQDQIQYEHRISRYRIIASKEYQYLHLLQNMSKNSSQFNIDVVSLLA